MGPRQGRNQRSAALASPVERFQCPRVRGKRSPESGAAGRVRPLGVLHKLPHDWTGAPLSANLDHAAVVSACGHRLAAPPKCCGRTASPRRRPCPGLASPDGRQGVPVIWSCDNDCIDLIVVEHSAQVAIGGNRLILLFEIASLFVESHSSHVAPRNAHARHLAELFDKLPPPPANSAGNVDTSQSDDRQTNLVVGSCCSTVPCSERAVTRRPNCQNHRPAKPSRMLLRDVRFIVGSSQSMGWGLPLSLEQFEVARKALPILHHMRSAHSILTDYQVNSRTNGVDTIKSIAANVKPGLIHVLPCGGGYPTTWFRCS